MRLSIMNICLILLGLCLCNVADCSRMLIPTSLQVSHLQDSCPEEEKQGGRSQGLLAELASELKKRFLTTVSHEDYSDLEAPPRLPEAQHGPVVFNHRKKRRPRSHGHP